MFFTSGMDQKFKVWDTNSVQVCKKRQVIIAVKRIYNELEGTLRYGSLLAIENRFKEATG